MFPHHENEIAQSQAHFGCSQWSNYWFHTGQRSFVLTQSAFIKVIGLDFVLTQSAFIKIIGLGFVLAQSAFIKIIGLGFVLTQSAFIKIIGLGFVLTQSAFIKIRGLGLVLAQSAFIKILWPHCISCGWDLGFALRQEPCHRYPDVCLILSCLLHYLDRIDHQAGCEQREKLETLWLLLACSVYMAII